jgi:putative transposase
MHREVTTRRSLPHWYKPGAIFFITYRLADSLPVAVMERLKAKQKSFLQQSPAPGLSRQEHRETAHKIWFGDYDAALDQSQDACLLADRRVASMVRENLYHHHGTKYYLLAYCIMRNHVHVLLQPTAEFQSEYFDSIGDQDDGHSPLSEIMHSLKSYTAHEANRILGRSGTFWQRESYDHWFRSEQELERIVLYIQANPVRADLAQRSEDYWWCSCHDRVLQDGEATAWLKWK